MHFEDLVRRIGVPAFEATDVAIFNVDCLQGLKCLPEATVDLTITSPPYNIGKSYESRLPLQEYLDWSEQWLELIANTTKPHGAFWLNLGYVPIPGAAKAAPLSYLLWNRVPMFFLQEVVWNYGAGVACKKMFSPRNEKFLWFVRDPEDYTFNLDLVRDPNVKYPNQKKNGKLKCNPLGKNPSDVWVFPKVTSGTNRSSSERTAHPAQFPESVIERIILSCSNEGDIILDPFSGSGTTAAVARRLGRKAIGFEILPEYVELSRLRLHEDITLEAIRAAQVDFGFME